MRDSFCRLRFASFEFLGQGKNLNIALGFHPEIELDSGAGSMIPEK